MGGKRNTGASDAERPFSVRLREDSAESHRLAERSMFIRYFMKGMVEAQTYVGLLSRLLAVYTEMEAALEEHHKHPALAGLFGPELVRADALRADLDYFGRPAEPTFSPATQAYVSRIQEARVGAPALLVAHSYTRYLGDLSGGQILASAAAKAMGLTPPDGLRFYDFPHIPDAKAYKQRYRQALDALPLSADEQDAIVAEVLDVFALNKAVFDELEGPLLETLGDAAAPNVRPTPQ